MSLYFRRILLIIFIILFVLSAVVLVLYTTGYRYNWQHQKLQKTSLLVLESVPSQAEVYLNEEKIADATPVRLTNLLPNEYLIEIKKAGFLTWSKKLQLEPNQTTFAENIILFKKQAATETILQSKKITDIKPLALSNLIYFVEVGETQAKIIKFNLLDRSRQEIFTSDTNLKIIDLNLNLEKALFRDNQGLKIFNLITQEVETDLSSDFQPLQILATKWNPTNSYELLIKTNAGLYLFSLVENKKILLIEKYVLDFIADDQNLYYLTSQNQNSTLWVQDLNSQKTQANIKLPSSLTYQIIDIHNDLITVLNPQDQNLYLINFSGNELILKETFNQAQGAQWTKESKNPRLLYYNDHEVYVYDYDYEREKYYTKILARYPETIDCVIWHPAYYHIIIQSGSSIKAIELDEREKNNIFELYQTPIKPKALYTNTKGNNLYFWLTENGQDKIIELPITEISGWFFAD